MDGYNGSYITIVYSDQKLTHLGLTCYTQIFEDEVEPERSFSSDALRAYTRYIQQVARPSTLWGLRPTLGRRLHSSCPYALITPFSVLSLCPWVLIGSLTITGDHR